VIGDVKMIDLRRKKSLDESFHSASLGSTMKLLEKDTDGDKVPDHFDCDPNDPKKQGVIHDVARSIGQKIRRKAVEIFVPKAGGLKTKAKESLTEQERIEDEAHKARMQERRKQAVEYAVAKERAKFQRKKAALNRGGGFKKRVAREARAVATVADGFLGTGGERKSYSPPAYRPMFEGRIGMSPPKTSVPKVKKKRRRRKKK